MAEEYYMEDPEEIPEEDKMAFLEECWEDEAEVESWMQQKVKCAKCGYLFTNEELCGNDVCCDCHEENIEY